MRRSTVASRRTSGPNWRILKFMAGFLKLIAWLIVIAGVALAVLLVLTVTNVLHLAVLPVPPETALLISIVYLVDTVLGFLLFYTLAELILLLVAIEYNTRQRYF